MAYDKNVDYSLLIKEAEAAGDYKAAAKYEQQRNEKIADMGLNYEQTNKYQTSTTPASSAPAGFTGSATTVGVNTQNQQALKDEMNANSQAWWNTTDQAEKDRLHNRNLEIQGILGGTVAFDDKTGTWSGDAAAQPILQPSFNYDTSSKPTYESNYNEQINSMLDAILNRADFSYNVEEDQLFQQYKNQYQREGNRAMNDALISAAAGAGGMNSYAITAAQQANDYWNAQLMDRIPELYQLAYEMYLTDIDNDMREFGLLTDLDDTQYNRYRDTMSDWYNDRDFAYNKYRDDMGDYKWQTEYDYGVSRDEVADSRYENEWEYGVSRDEVDDSRYESETAYRKAMELLDMGTMPDASTLAAAGISTAEATAYMAAIKQQNAPKTSSSSSSSSSSSKGSGTGTGGGGGSKWDDVMAWVNKYGEDTAENYIKENYKALGYSSQSAALAGWENYLLTIDDGNGGGGGGGNGVVEPTEEEFDVSALGDPAVVNYIEALYSVGAVKLMGNKFAWASGWSKDNYREKLKSATMQNIFTGFGDTP